VSALVDLTSWAERLYSESDGPRSLATSLAGLIGLGVYLGVGDWVIAVFAAVIAFPLARVLFTWLGSSVEQRLASRRAAEALCSRLAQLSPAERDVVDAFVESGGRVLTWGRVNSLELGGPAFESLRSRGLIDTGMTADSMRETFVLDEEVFDAARQLRNAEQVMKRRPGA